MLNFGKMIRFVILILLVYSQNVLAQGSYGEWKQKFEQLGTMLPTPNTYRTASGAPGIDYWQQRADYKIDVTIDDETQMLYGEEEITYYNNSPDVLRYLWIQLDQNMRANNSNSPLVTPSKMSNTYSGKSLQRLTNSYTNSKGEKYNGGYEISYVKDKEDKNLNYSIVSTMMRIDLEKPMSTGDSYTFKIKWSFEINDRMKIGGRGGYEYFPKDKNYSYTIAQWFPRMAVYDDKEGWQNKQFLGRGEFALAFGDYELNVTVPADFIVAATGDLQNPQQVLTKKELERYERAKKTVDKPVLITTQDEAIKKENNPIKNKTKTWRYKAEMVRDVAFAASRKFIWDAMAVQLDNYTPLAMSYYSKEGNPLWEEESTKAVANTLQTYSEHTIEYPYPVAISVHAASIGMEYPMICFNFGRPNEDGTYSDATKWRMISVIIHEVGHFFIPMIINSDERQWTWMDEGLNTFIQSLTQKEYYKDMPLRRGTAESMVDYMRSPKDMLRPIMTNSEQIAGREFGANAYGKPASALSVLRETIMGPELFDYAFKEYSRRWAFKHPDPADFFRTMEDASAIALDWFWRGWFYTTDNVDVSVEGVKWFKMKNVDKPFENKAKVENKEIKGRKNQSDDPKYAMPFEPSEFYFSETNKNEYREFMNEVDDDKIKLQNSNKNFYEVTFKNIGGLVTPLIIEWTYEDGSIEIEKLPAEIWRFNETEVSKVFAKDKVVKNIKLDPNKETADVNISDNNFPRLEIKSDFEKFRN